MKIQRMALLSALVVALTLLPAAAQSTGYQVLNTYQIGGDGGWDYLTLDETNHRLYIARESRAQIVDTQSGKLVGELADTPGIHGVALVPGLKRAVTSNGKANSATIFDLETMKAIGQVPTGEKPDAIIFDPASKLVFAMNGKSNSASAIDPKELKVVGTVPLTGNPEFAVADGRGTVFINLESAGAIAAVDSRKLSVKAVWPMAGCEEPTGLAMDRKNHRLFSVCHNQKMMVVDSDSGKVVATLPIGAHVDAAAYDPKTQCAFSSNGDGTLTVVHEDSPDKFHVTETVSTQPGARTMALDPSSHKIYLVTAKYGPAPAASADSPRPRRPMIADSFTVLVVGPAQNAAHR
jgi:YVTN family beta-propeller protein